MMCMTNGMTRSRSMMYPFGLRGRASLGPISRTLRTETLLSDLQPFTDTMIP